MAEKHVWGANPFSGISLLNNYHLKTLNSHTDHSFFLRIFELLTAHFSPALWLPESSSGWLRACQGLYQDGDIKSSPLSSALSLRLFLGVGEGGTKKQLSKYYGQSHTFVPQTQQALIAMGDQV